jgi:MGT family glycosyltransferase
MARILVGTIPVIGHVNPMLPVARALVARGHELRWYTGSKYRARVEATGAGFVGLTHARDYDDARISDEFAGRSALTGTAQLKFDMKHVFIDNAQGQLRDLQALQKSFAPELLLVDPGVIGAIFQQELNGPPALVLGVLPMVMSSVDTAPFGLGLPPSASPLGRMRNRALNWAVEHVLFRDVQQHWNAARNQVGLEPTGWWLNSIKRAALYLQPSVPGFEYPRSDLPGNVRFIGAITPGAPSDWSAPDFWHEIDGGRPIVHVTQGTIANETPTLIAPALEGLAGEDVLVVVSTGGRPPASLGLRNVPANARIASFLSYPELLPKTSVMVTNGGYGGVQTALEHGVPLVVAGVSEDKPEVAARVAWSGAGLDLKTAAPSPARVRQAVRTLLADPRYRERALALAAEYVAHDAVARAVALVEEFSARDRRAHRPGHLV